jgi:hypothetical protein
MHCHILFHAGIGMISEFVVKATPRSLPDTERDPGGCGGAVSGWNCSTSSRAPRSLRTASRRGHGCFSSSRKSRRGRL